MDNAFSKVHPELIGEWSERNLPITPENVSYGSKKIFWWKGSCGHEWQTSVKARSAGEKCPICSGARVIPGINDLATTNPELAEEWSDRNGLLSPTMLSAGSHKKIIWRGKCGHEWTATVKSRTQGSGCPYCSHNRILPGFNDLASVYPELAGEWSEKNLPLLPTMVTPFANRKVWWRCRLGHEWNTLISTRSAGGRCPYYSERKGLIVNYYNETAIGIPIDVFIPEIKLAIDVEHDSKDISRIKAHLCKQRGIRYNIIENRVDESEENMICGIMKAFQGVHIFIRADAERDAAFMALTG